MPYYELGSPEYRILEADKNDIVWEKLSALRCTNQEKLQTIYEVCSRLRFVDQLRYNTQLRTKFFIPFWGNEHSKEKKFQYQIDRLKTYLTLTCIDAISKERWIPFNEWILGEIKHPSEESTKSFDDLHKRLTTYNLTPEIDKFIGSWLKELSQVYYDEFGDRKNFTRFIVEDIPVWLNDWLSMSCYLKRGDIDSKKDLREFYTLPPDKKLRLFADYIYCVRNRFTHTVFKSEPHEDDQVKPLRTFREDLNRREIIIRNIYANGDPAKQVEWTVGIESKSTESEIIRTLLIAQIRKKILEIMDDPTFLSKYLDRQKYIKIGYLFAEELFENWSSIGAWLDLNQSKRRNITGSFSNSILKTNWAVEFTEIHNRLYPHLQNVIYPSLLKEHESFHKNHFPEIKSINLLEYRELVDGFNSFLASVDEAAQVDDAKSVGERSENSGSKKAKLLKDYIECIARDLLNRLDNLIL